MTKYRICIPLTIRIPLEVERDGHQTYDEITKTLSTDELEAGLPEALWEVMKNGFWSSSEGWIMEKNGVVVPWPLELEQVSGVTTEEAA